MILLMPNTSVAIKLQPAERTQLKTWESAHGTPQQVALRCRIILGAVAGQNNVSIAEALGVSRPTVQLWRTRVHEQGIGAVWEIAPGRGRKPQYGQAQRAAIIRATLQTKPKGMTHWSCRLMAEVRQLRERAGLKTGDRGIHASLEPQSQALHLDDQGRGHHQEDRAGAGEDGADQARIHPAAREKEGSLTVNVFKGHYISDWNKKNEKRLCGHTLW